MAPGNLESIQYPRNQRLFFESISGSRQPCPLWPGPRAVQPRGEYMVLPGNARSAFPGNTIYKVSTPGASKQGAGKRIHSDIDLGKIGVGGYVHAVRQANEITM